jgi:ribosome-associated protein YbcJ (S4-like RNA binding protein)
LNGEVCLMRGKKLVEGDVVTVGGKIYEVVHEG